MLKYFLNFSKNFIMSMSKLPKVVFVLGGPGAGKGTACFRIVEQFGFTHLSAGDLLRAERNRPGSEFGELIESYIRDGKIVPVNITCSLLEKAMKETDNDKFLIDGFPRNEDNLTGWNESVSSKVELLFVLYLDCPEDICVNRCLNRGAAGSGRSDDNIESMKKRLHTFINETQPIIKYYEKLNLVKKIDGRGTPQEVFHEIQKIFNEFNF